MEDDNKYNPALILMEKLASIKSNNNKLLCEKFLFSKLVKNGDIIDYINELSVFFGHIGEIESLTSTRSRPALKYLSKVMTDIINAYNRGRTGDDISEVIDDHTFNYLDGLIENINYKMPKYNELSDSNLDEYKTTLQAVLDEVLVDANLEAEVRQYFNQFISEIIKDLNDYSILGSAALLAKLKSKIGDVFLSENTQKAINKSPTVFNKILKAIFVIGATITGTTNFGVHNLENINKMQSEFVKLQDNLSENPKNDDTVDVKTKEK